MQSVRRTVRFAASDHRVRANQMPRMQKAGSQTLVPLQFTGEVKAIVGLGCEKGWFHRLEARQQRRVRKAVAANCVRYPA